MHVKGLVMLFQKTVFFYYVMTYCLRFFAEVNTKFQKMQFFGRFKDHISQEGNMETMQMTPFFSCTFSAVTVCIIHFGA